MHIIEANEIHLEGLVTLFDEYRVWYRKASDMESARKFLTDRMANRESIIYLVQDPVNLRFAGFTQLYPLFSSTRMGKLWLLNDLFVIPEYRGRGISIQLLNQAKDLAKKTNAVGIMLETEKSNQIGNQLYPRAGFRQEDEMNNFFWQNEVEA